MMAEDHALSPEIRELLETIRDALTLPYGATPADHDERTHLMKDRVATILPSLNHVLRQNRIAAAADDVRCATRVLREALDERLAVTYATREE